MLQGRLADKIVLEHATRTGWEDNWVTINGTWIFCGCYPVCIQLSTWWWVLGLVNFVIVWSCQTKSGLFLTSNDYKQSISYRPAFYLLRITTQTHTIYHKDVEKRRDMYWALLADELPLPPQPTPKLHCQQSLLHPKLQKMPFTPELSKYVRYLKDKIKESDLKGLVEAVLVEYETVSKLKDHPKFKGNLNFSINRNFRFE